MQNDLPGRVSVFITEITPTAKAKPMSARRSISWSSALSDLRADRQQVPAGFLGARGRVEVFVKFQCRPLIVNGQFDRAAIMKAAVIAAKAHQDRFGDSWADAMSVALKAAWQAARTARAKTAN
jgi:hypothetical protein